MGKVKKIFKKVAPVVLPIALGAMTMGPIAAATLGSGIGTLIQGGSFKQALMSAAMGAAFSGGLGSLAGSLGPGGTSSLKQFSIMRGIGNISQKMVNMTGSVKLGANLGKGSGITGAIGRSINQLGQKVRSGVGTIFKDPEALQLQKIADVKPGIFTPEMLEKGIDVSYGVPGELGTTVYSQDALKSALSNKGVIGGAVADQIKNIAPEQLKDATERITTKDLLKTGEAIVSDKDALEEIPPSDADTGDTENKGFFKGIIGGTADWWKELGKSDYGRAKQAAVAGLGAGALYAGYKALTKKEVDELSPDDLAKRMASMGSPTDAKYVSQFNPTGMYSSYPGRITQDLFKYDYPTAGSLGPNLQPWTPAAKGGIMNSYAGGGFPRRTGQINGPGTGTSDDVPAMLSDGEFVMTAQAVRNAGGGSRAAGAKRMYNLMNNLERGVA